MQVTIIILTHARAYHGSLMVLLTMMVTLYSMHYTFASFEAICDKHPVCLVVIAVMAQTCSALCAYCVISKTRL